MKSFTSAKLHLKLFSQIIEESLEQEKEIALTEEKNLLNFNTELKIKERNTDYLKKAREALVRIKNGTYGICKECDSMIDEQRLLARPVAELCISCKEAEEREEKLSSHSKMHHKTIVNNNILYLKEANTNEVDFNKDVKAIEANEKYLA